jgi:hypothetical protein
MLQRIVAAAALLCLAFFTAGHRGVSYAYAVMLIAGVRVEL